MTDTREALIKELDECIEIEAKSGGTATTLATLRRARDTLSAPGDAEREELAKLTDRCIEYASMFGFTKREVSQFKLIGADLRRPVAPVDEAMVHRFLDARFNDPEDLMHMVREDWNTRAPAPVEVGDARVSVWAREHGLDEFLSHDQCRAAMQAAGVGAVDGVVISHEMNDFLHGSGALKGKWFGELHPHHSGAYWWRRFLPRSGASMPVAASTGKE